MLVLRQLIEKWLDMQWIMAVGFVDLEEAYDTVPQYMQMATVNWVGVPESQARMVEAMYERTNGRVVVGSGLSEEFPVDICWMQRNALSLLVCVMVMELISNKVSTIDVLTNMMYA